MALIRKPEDLELAMEEAWYGLGDTSLIKTPDDLKDLWTDDGESPLKKFVKYIRDPKNFAFTCKYILGVQLMPFQLVILQEMWNHRFPILIGSRGLSKCITGDSLLISSKGLYKIQDIIKSDVIPNTKQYIDDLYLMGENGYKKVDYGWCNGSTETIKIKTHHGYSLEGTKNHPIRVVRDGSLQWVELQNIKLGDYIAIYRNEEVDWRSSFDLTPDQGWFLGSLIGDGGYTVRGRISFTSADQYMHDEMDRIAQQMFNKSFSLVRNGKYSKILYGVDIWDRLFSYYGFNSPVCGLKDIPECIYKSNKSTVAAFISGLLDTDGTVYSSGGIGFSSKSPNLAHGLQKLLLLFGITSRVKPRLNKKYTRYYYHLYFFGLENLRKFHDLIGFRLKSKQVKLEQIINLGAKPNTNVDVLPHELILNTILKLREKYYQLKNRPIKQHGVSDLFSMYRYKQYQISYKKLAESLEYFKLCRNEPEWQLLNEINDQHYFYDKISDINSSENITYDVHIPEDHSFVSNGFISHNSFLLAVYTILRCLLKPEHKTVVVGAGFRQSKVIFEYCDTIWGKGRVLQSICERGYYSKQGPRRDTDRAVLQICDSQALFLPIGTGEKIRGQRANTIISDEFAAIDESIYEVVISGFGAVSASPVENVMKKKKAEYARSLGLNISDEALDFNQSIISGTCDYDFNHFARYWKRYKSIIESKGDERVLNEIFKDTKQEWSDYSIMRIPYNLLPDGYLDRATVARAAATMHSVHFLLEYNAVFAKDSMGFFKRTLIEACIVKPDMKKDEFPTDVEVFHPMLTGNSKKKYVFAIDPASEIDNFAVVIIELNNTHRRIVYTWTTSKNEYKKEFNSGKTVETDFYGYCTRKIRQLMRVFPCERIGCDAQGGGVAIREALHNIHYIGEGELPIWEVRDPDKPKDTDNKHGLHILELIQFADGDWTAQANHGMRKDLEDKVLLFPYYDSASLELAAIDDEEMERLGKLGHDSMENCTFEIEELKNELTTIVQTKTNSGRDRWDTPETKNSVTNKKGRLRKDRYSALVIANMIARQIMMADGPTPYDIKGGYAQQIAMRPNKGHRTGKLFDGPDWYNRSMEAYMASLTRRR